jgi:hypothetical protein
MLPKMVRFNIEELNEIAIHLNLQKKYGIDIDLLDHMVRKYISYVARTSTYHTLANLNIVVFNQEQNAGK